MKTALIEIKRRGDQPIVEVFAASGFGATDDQAARVGENASPVENRDLPLNRDEAEGLIEQYLSDLNPKEKELVAKRLCGEEGGFGDKKPSP